MSELTQNKIKDPFSGEFFLPKRPNQRFSCHENQVKFNNLRAKITRQKTSFFNTPLQKNFKILDNLLFNRNEIKVHKEFLLGKGFSLDIYTGIEEFQNKPQFTVYTFMLIPISTDYIKITRI